MIGIRLAIGLGVSFLRNLVGGGPTPPGENDVMFGGDVLMWGDEVVAFG